MPPIKGQKFAKSLRRLIRIEKAVRLELAGYRDTEIAFHIDISYGALMMMKQHPDYKALRIQVANGISSELHKNTATDLEYLTTKVQSMVPLALQNLEEAALQRLDKNLAFKASEAILDRDGRFAKVSRTGVALPSQGGFAASEKDNAMASALLAALATRQDIALETAVASGEEVETGTKETVQ